MKEYTILMVEYDFNLMVSCVKHFLDEGWTCQGGIAVEEKAFGQPKRFYQAMVRA